MKSKFRLFSLSAALGLAMAIGFTSCKNEVEELESDKANGDKNARVAAFVTIGTCGANTLISTSTTWTTETIIRGNIRVLSGATLTIPAGSVIKGECGANLIIERGGKISAVGTAANPIVFTSNQPTNAKTRGFWGGVIILGNGITNKGTNVAIEGINFPAGTTLGFYGGTNNADNSGSFKFVRIEYPGTEISDGNEINGLTLGGVGSGTAIDHVQVLYSQDDGFEFFGGAVNPRFLYAFGNSDDDYDTDFGYVGKVQFAVSVKTTSSEPGAGSSNGFESDNDATGTAATPKTNPRFANVTLVGPCASPDATVFGQGLLLRRNTELDLYNSVITQWTKAITIQAPSVAGAPGVDLKSVSVFDGGVLSPTPLAGVTVSAGAAPFNPCPVPCYSTAATIAAGAGPNLIPSADITGVTAPGVGFTSVTYRGAFSATAANNSNWDLRSENSTFDWLSFPCEGFSQF